MYIHNIFVIAKRFGTALRKLAASGTKAGVTLVGRGFGKLKQTTINKLTAYYGKAVRDSPNDDSGMQSAMLVTFEHAISTDNKPQHDRCLVGVDSWCFYNDALTIGQVRGPQQTNDPVLPCESWCPLGRRLASSWKVVVMGSWPKLRLSNTRLTMARQYEHIPTTSLGCYARRCLGYPFHRTISTVTSHSTAAVWWARTQLMFLPEGTRRDLIGWITSQGWFHCHIRSDPQRYWY